MADSSLSSNLSYAEFAVLVRRFADIIPDLLARHPATAPLALDVQALRLNDSLESRFTVSVVGQMKIGKSTLVNALVGRSLAPVGVTETTATTNWFRHGIGEICDHFRVHWNDGSTVDLSLELATQWIGQNDVAKRTQCLDFFSNADFLTIANIVDTPGTGSNIADHTKVTEQFVYSGKQDAVVYVVNPVARIGDRDMLELFGEKSRMPGAFGYNSIMAVQKWEQLEPDPFIEVEKKCSALRAQFSGKVSEVIPVSGMLANLAREVPVEIWDKVAGLACQSSSEALEALLGGPSMFVLETPGAALNGASRKEFFKYFEWAGLVLSLKLARSRQIAEGQRLKQAIHEASGIDEFKALLQVRFFSLASLIKASAVLHKAWAPCTVALLRLRELVQLRQEEALLAKESQAILAGFKNMSQLDPVRAYVTRSLAAVGSDLSRVRDIREQIDIIKEQAASYFFCLEEDLACLSAIEKIPEVHVSNADRIALGCLFGAKGPDIKTRIMLHDLDDSNAVIEQVWERRDYWASKKRGACGLLLKVCDHALHRLDLVLEYLEENHGERHRD